MAHPGHSASFIWRQPFVYFALAAWITISVFLSLFVLRPECGYGPSMNTLRSSERWSARTEDQIEQTRTGRTAADPSIWDVAIIMVTGEVYHKDRLAEANRTWWTWLPPGYRSRQMYIMSDALDPSIPTIFANGSCCGYEKSKRKWREGLLHVRDYSPPHVQWVWIMDDDAFLLIPNMVRFLRQPGVSPHRRAFHGQRCPEVDGYAAACGGATLLIPRKVSDELATWLEPRPWPPKETAEETWPDRILPMVLEKQLGVELIDHKEFCSQTPDGYAQVEQGKIDKPQGVGRAVSFHYTITVGDVWFLTFTAGLGSGTEWMVEVGDREAGQPGHG